MASNSLKKASSSHALARPSFFRSIPSSCGWNLCGIPGLTRRWALYTRKLYPALLPPEPRSPCRGSLVFIRGSLVFMPEALLASAHRSR
jgi:hypothetical protein